MKVIFVVGTRPNFMKIAPLIRAIEKYNISSTSGNSFKPTLVHTGQHYDSEMSKVFFEDLELPEPDIYLRVGSGTHAEQTGRIMIELEKVLLNERPDVVAVVGDVNSTLAGALAAVKLHIPVIHIEAGLRSFDRQMPEEINRILTDQISDYLFTTCKEANENLRNEGITEEKIFLVGNVMVDSLHYNKERTSKSDILPRLGLERERYIVLTLHRPENVDSEESLVRIIKATEEISRKISIVFPVHPRTRKRLKELNHFNQLSITNHQVLLIEPLGYLDFLCLMMNAKFLMTDSGGIQEETTVLNIPCLTLRRTTERPNTISEGTNTLVGNETEEIVREAFKILDGWGREGKCPQLWDGNAAERIIKILSSKF